ncbi:Coenzyme F420 hydrogenase/dehydrogenase, beta subunit C-terminal domain [Pseudobutyrivibrio xylanivorans]|uniref:Coenzyme F420-reducing hydrogenase, beta subunit n=1 Tax=Pseudobutyrivibrio xylanivorans TaxID=185007 RepID=A0A1G5S0R4_PSEXY|nr:Coenzyme F420 hydrogenase/dehydrogenase, beta subunit C-terminal domain [Pseudobutyrivibrio xylanivorans]SCZ79717.1 Coenzyme F420-reducing hydrogenase, beta subunit [Pseudobutyrivibrio xylanivorans]
MTVCDKDKCAGCMLCVEVCKKDAIHIEDTLNAYNAIIDENKCINCNACHNKCPQNKVPEKKNPIVWYQGWNKNDNIRAKSPSGGVGTALTSQFIKTGGYVCSCMFKDGEFCFDITNDPEIAMSFGGSKYVKSNPTGVYPKILEKLKADNKVLFIGLPCQVAAVKNYVGDRYAENLYLVDLICHGTPSPKLLDKFLNQYHKSLASIKEIKFRLKAKMQIVVDDEGIVCKGVSDKYTIGFLNGLTYTKNCYSCNYASESRISDITIGDSWGSKLPVEEAKKGISLMVVQTAKGDALIKDSEIECFDVDKEIAKNNNGQLVSPMTMPNVRESFFEKIKVKKFNKLILTRYKKDCFKQDVKYLMIKLHIINQG